MNTKIYEFLENRVDLLKHKDHDRTEERRTSSEIFDESTMMLLYKLLCEGIFDTLEFPISTGKEANVFRGTKGDRFVAVKIFRVATSTFRNFGMYIHGDPRFKNIGRDHRSLIYTWARKEQKNLARMREAGIRVPEPLACRGNVLVMEYIGQPDSAAPMLRDARLGQKALAGVKRSLLEYMDLCYNRAGLVHGDLSEYNVLINGKDTVLIDVGQAVVLEHPMAQELFVRDLQNIAAYFKRQGQGFDWSAVHNQIISHKKTGEGVVHEEE
jgi:RIO kinase 1